MITEWPIFVLPPLLDRILEAAKLGESDDVEFKSALGGLPASMWESYSAMANSTGGFIVLGAKQRSGAISLDGLPIEAIQRYKKSIWDLHNNRQTISRSLLAPGDVQEIQIEDKWILVIKVPAASRKERPIYKGQNPLEGTYKRRHEGDYRCSPEEVRRMLADADDIPADARILEGFRLDDLDKPTLAVFRNLFAAAKPGHPWLALEDMALLQQLGCWRSGRDNNVEGLTIAGLLMFGKHQAIISPSGAPEYFVDFRDYRGRAPSQRWGDRLFPDGSWEANLLQFYIR